MCHSYDIFSKTLVEISIIAGKHEFTFQLRGVTDVFLFSVQGAATAAKEVDYPLSFVSLFSAISWNFKAKFN